MSEQNLSKDIRRLSQKVMSLKNVPQKKLDDAICDIIDEGGYSLAVLLDRMNRLSVKRQQRVAQKIEDFLYFHPASGKKLISRMKKSLEKVHESCVPSILTSIIDVSEKTSVGVVHFPELFDKALVVMNADVDLPRKSRVLNIIVEAECRGCIPLIIDNMKKAVVGLHKYENYNFIEASLLALKRLGGEPILRLLIDPDSVDAIHQLRLEWRSHKEENLAKAVKAIKELDENFAQVLLKVIDLSEFNLPFISMIKEGLSHNSKWVRQTAAASMKSVGEALSVEAVTRMLNDPASEVRLMAVSSLGGFDASITGEMLEKLASKDGESIDLRLNALYALYAQKNLASLKLLSSLDNMRIAVNAQGLSALLMPHEDGLKQLLARFVILKNEFLNDIAYYLLELLEPKDIKELVKFHKQCNNETHKERLLSLIRTFIEKGKGPHLDKAIQALSEGERKAIQLLNNSIGS